MASQDKEDVKRKLFLDNQKNLNPLDKSLEYTFQFQEIQFNFEETQTLEKFLIKNPKFKSRLAKYLINMLEEICSISFELLATDKISEN